MKKEEAQAIILEQLKNIDNPVLIIQEEYEDTLGNYGISERTVKSVQKITDEILDDLLMYVALSKLDEDELNVQVGWYSGDADEKYMYLTTQESIDEVEQKKHEAERIASVKSILERCNYNVDTLTEMVQNAINKFDQENNREDWMCDYAPTQQGAQDAMDSRYETLSVLENDKDALINALQILKGANSLM